MVLSTICRDDMDDMVNNFNTYFVNVGLKLAEQISDPGPTEGWNEKLISRNPKSIFLSAVEEREILDIVNKCKNKVSTDCDGINMIVKNVMEVIF